MIKKSPKCLLITRSGSGFGKLIALHLSKSGFYVIAAMRKPRDKFKSSPKIYTIKQEYFY